MSLLLQVNNTLVPTSQDLMKQGPVISLLILAILYFYNRQKIQETSITTANEKLEKYLAEDREALLTALNNNTSALEKFGVHAHT